MLGYVAGEIVAHLSRWACFASAQILHSTFPILKSMLGYSLYIFGVSIVQRARRTNGDYFIVGRSRHHCARYYTIAYKVPEMLLESVYWVFSSVVFPAYSGCLRDWRRFIAGGGCSLVACGHIMGILGGRHRLSAENVVVVAFGEKWQPAVRRWC